MDSNLSTFPSFFVYIFGDSGKLAFPGAMPGYMSPLWNGNRLPYVRPFPEQYPYPGTWPFGAANIPSPAFHVPMYMPPTYGGLPHYG